MEKNNLIVTSSPHIFTQDSISKIMYNVAGALIPIAIVGVYFFGLRALTIIVISILTCMATEATLQLIRNKPVTIRDGSALVTGLLFALVLPPTLPIWIVVIGAIVSIGLGKQVFGGLGHNPFNPALVGRAFVAISFPVYMTTWINPVDGITSSTPIDAVSMATPLNMLKAEGIATDYLSLFIGRVGGSIGETSAVLIILGGLYLLYKGYTDYRIPLGYLGTVAILSTILGHDPLFHLLAGGLMIGAFFMATDMVTTPVTKTGRLIFGIGAGVIVMIIRLYGAYPEGVLFSILLMNAFTPIIDRYTRPRVYGKVR